MGKKITIGPPRIVDIILLSTVRMQGVIACGDLERRVDESDGVRVACVNDVAVAMWGMKRHGVLSPAEAWLVVSRSIVKYKRDFLRLSKPLLALLSGGKTIRALIDSSDCRAARYIEWLGFRPHRGWWVLEESCD